MIEQILERIAKALEENNEINKKGWERNITMSERYLALNPLPTDSNTPTSEIQPTGEYEDVVKEVDPIIELKEGICVCGHDYRTHGIAGCFIRIKGNHCPCYEKQPKESLDWLLIKANSTLKIESVKESERIS